MASSNQRRFAESHEWFSVDGDVVTIGISQYAANELTDITFVEMKPVGSRIQAGETVGELESVKTTSDIYSAVEGEIVEVNAEVGSDPGLINSDPFGRGWLVKIRASDPAPLATLMDEPAYDKTNPVS